MKRIIIAVIGASLTFSLVHAQQSLPPLGGCFMGTTQNCYGLVKQTKLQLGGYICVYENAYGTRKVFKSLVSECHEEIQTTNY